MAARVVRQECASGVDREIGAGRTPQVMDSNLIVLSIVVAWCASVVGLISWMYNIFEVCPATPATDEILTPETITTSEDLEPHSQQQQEEPATWHISDLSSAVMWQLNPLALGMGAEMYFEEGYGGVTEIRLFEHACAGECDEANIPATPSTGRKLQPVSGVADNHVEVVAPLASLTSSQVNVRDATSPTKPSDSSKLKPSGEVVPTVDLWKKASEAEKEAARRRAKYEPPLEIWGRTGPTSGLQKWDVTWCPRDATPVRSTPARRSHPDSRSTSAVRVRARQAAAALGHVARLRTSTAHR